jgi:hypothetical protein
VTHGVTYDASTNLHARGLVKQDAAEQQGPRSIPQELLEQPETGGAKGGSIGDSGPAPERTP